MKYFCLAILFVSVAVSASAQNLTAMEYFIDIDPGIGAAIPVSITSGAALSDVSFQAPVTGLSVGIHRLYTRVKNAAGIWTITNSKSFYVSTPPPAPSSFVAAEYFIDTDPGLGLGTAIPGVTSSVSLNNVSFSANIASLSAGFHRIYIRTKTQLGSWSITWSRAFYVEPPPANYKIVKLEYFIDSDPGYEGAGASGVPITPPASSVNSKAISVSTSSLSQGTHTIFMRGKNDAGTWTGTQSASFTVTAPGTTTILIDTYPSDTLVCASNSVNLNVNASGTTNITYQWQYAPTFGGTFANISDGGGYSGTTKATLSVDAKTPAFSGFYQCTIAGDGAASVLTNEARLQIVTAPAAPTATAGAPACTPGSVVLTASGGSDGQYRWYTVATGGTPLAGAADASYTTLQITTSAAFFVAVANGGCESPRTAVNAVVKGCHAPEILSSTQATSINGKVTLDLQKLITDEDNDVDPGSLTATTASGAPLTLNGFIATIDYGGTNSATADVLTIGVCDLTALCASQDVTILFADDITVFNGISPNGDQSNEVFYIQYIDILPRTIENKVTIFDRWGDEVFSMNNYNNLDRAFKGYSSSGNKLPTAIYFYKIEFASGEKTRIGYLSLKH